MQIQKQNNDSNRATELALGTNFTYAAPLPRKLVTEFEVPVANDSGAF